MLWSAVIRNLTCAQPTPHMTHNIICVCVWKQVVAGPKSGVCVFVCKRDMFPQPLFWSCVQRLVKGSFYYFIIIITALSSTVCRSKTWYIFFFYAIGLIVVQKPLKSPQWATLLHCFLKDVSHRQGREVKVLRDELTRCWWCWSLHGICLQQEKYNIMSALSCLSYFL